VCETCGSFPSDFSLVQKEGKLYCKKDYRKLFAENCGLCGNEIISKSTVALLNMKCHMECVNCSVCKKHLLPESGSPEIFKSKKSSNALLCKEHYLEENAKICSGCSKPILGGSLLNVKDRFFHVECFTCKTCSQNLKGEKFAFVGNDLRCRNHLT
jgi:actin-binding LIM protein